MFILSEISPDTIFILLLLTTLFAAAAGIFAALSYMSSKSKQPAFNQSFAILEEKIKTLASSSSDDISRLRQELTNNFNLFRQENSDGREKFETALNNATDKFANTQAQQLNENNKRLGELIEKNDKNAKDLSLGLTQSLEKIQKSNEEKLELIRIAVGEKLPATLNERLTENNKALNDIIVKNDKNAKDMSLGLTQSLEKIQKNNDEKLELIRVAVGEKLPATLNERLTENTKSLNDIIAKNNQNAKELSDTLALNLDKLRNGNEKKLEEMRLTVDEKLQGTLTERLGQGFKQVADNLEQVHKGLGEMKNLATGVGDLKRVLTNVKSRGTWGEVQLEMLLQDFLTPNQYDKNVHINPSSREVVEFAVKLPSKATNGKGDDSIVYIPIDAKFPQEDYEKLIKAQEDGDKEQTEILSLNLEKIIRKQAQDIESKYIVPPYSTNFAIMYLPTEGLFAEVIRRPGLVQDIQIHNRVAIAGPNTLAIILNSFQMGFKSLAIEKRSSEVWKILEATKAEFNKYGTVMDRLRDQLKTAQNTVDKVGTRTRAINRSLRDVETYEIEGSNPETILSLKNYENDDEDSETI